MNEVIDIFICSYLRSTFTGQTIAYLKERTKYPYRLWLLDNGENGEYRDKVDFYVPFKENIGIHPIWQIAFGLAESDYFITSDNDIAVPNVEPDWLTQLVGLMDTYPDFGAIALQPHKFIGLEPERHPNDGEILYTPMVGAVMRMLRREAVWKANGWERVIRANRNHEERTICSRLETAGYKFGYSAKMKAFHMWGDGESVDDWGYPLSLGVETHGHHPVWPQPRIFGDMSKYDLNTFNPI